MVALVQPAQAQLLQHWPECWHVHHGDGVQLCQQSPNAYSDERKQGSMQAGSSSNASNPVPGSAVMQATGRPE
jgi:hypothetical protein